MVGQVRIKAACVAHKNLNNEERDQISSNPEEESGAHGRQQVEYMAHHSCNTKEGENLNLLTTKARSGDISEKEQRHMHDEQERKNLRNSLIWAHLFQNGVGPNLKGLDLFTSTHCDFSITVNGSVLGSTIKENNKGCKRIILNPKDMGCFIKGIIGKGNNSFSEHDINRSNHSVNQTPRLEIDWNNSPLNMPKLNEGQRFGHSFSRSSNIKSFAALEAVIQDCAKELKFEDEDRDHQKQVDNFPELEFNDDINILRMEEEELLEVGDNDGSDSEEKLDHTSPDEVVDDIRVLFDTTQQVTSDPNLYPHNYSNSNGMELCPLPLTFSSPCQLSSPIVPLLSVFPDGTIEGEGDDRSGVPNKLLLTVGNKHDKSSGENNSLIQGNQICAEQYKQEDVVNTCLEALNVQKV